MSKKVNDKSGNYWYSHAGMSDVRKVNSAYMVEQREADRKARMSKYGATHKDFVDYLDRHPHTEPVPPSDDVFNGVTDLGVTKPAGKDYYEELHKDFSNYHKFGNNQNDVDEIAAKIVEHYNLHLLTKNTFRGGKFGGGCSPFSRAANNGLHVGALPNGRKKGTALFADSIGSVPGMDSDGPTSLINSVLKYNQYLAKSGFILNLKFNKELFGKDENIDKFISLAKTYLENGGQQLSVLVISAEELLDAKIHPELHKNLIVRVGGYSDYFNNLSSDLQDNVISRTLINI